MVIPMHMSARSHRDRYTRPVLAVTAAAALTVSLGACGGGDDLEKEGGGDKLVVGAAAFTESRIVAQLYSGVLSKAGYKATVREAKSRELYEPELEKGRIDVVPEYAATMAEFLNAKENGPKADPVASPDVDKTVTALEKLAKKRGLKVLPAGKAVDQNAFAVSKDYAAKHKLKSLSDLGRTKESVTVAAGDECETRPFCQPGLEKKYGIDVKGIDPKGVGTTQAKQAVKDGKDQLVLTTTTDATLDQFGLTILKDDKKLQNADNILPVVNAKSDDKKITDALGKLNRTLTTKDLTDLNRQVDQDRKKPEDVAKEYLEKKNLG